MGYSSQFRPMISPTAQQSGFYAQKQSYVAPGCNFLANSASSSAMTSSFYPAQQAPLPTVGSNVVVTQSNYVPNYQFRHWRSKQLSELLFSEAEWESHLKKEGLILYFQRV